MLRKSVPLFFLKRHLNIHFLPSLQLHNPLFPLPHSQRLDLKSRHRNPKRLQQRRLPISQDLSLPTDRKFPIQFYLPFSHPRQQPQPP